jgi:hypothetical protein
LKDTHEALQNAPSRRFIGVTVLLWKLIVNPVALENMSSAFFSFLTSSIYALARMIVSSAYCKTGHGPLAIGW